MKKTTALIFSPITMGYGSPQFLYMYDTLKQLGLDVILIEKYENHRLFEFIEGYHRYLLRFDHLSLFLFQLYILYLFLFKNARIIVCGWDINFPFFYQVAFNLKALRYYLEVEDSYDWMARKYPDNTNNGYKSPISIDKKILIKIKLLLAISKQWLRCKIEKPLKYELLISPEENRLEIAKKQFTSIPNYLVMYNTPPINTKGAIRKLSIEKPVVLYQGQINWYSMAQELLATIALSHKKFNYILAGPCDKENRPLLDEFIEKGWLKYYGWLKRSELDSLRSSAHVGLVLWRSVNLATRFACPNKLYEYIAAGLPVVCTPNESLINYYTKYKFGVMMDDFSSLSLLDSLNNLVSNRERYSTISSANLNIHLEELNWEHQAKPLVSFVSKNILLN